MNVTWNRKPRQTILLCPCPDTTPPFMQNSCPVFFLLSPPRCLLVFLSHLSICSLTTCPFFTPSVPPSLLLSCRSAVIWTDVSGELIIPSSCCLPTTTLFPSCVTVALSPFPSASPCHSHCLRPFHPSLYHVYYPLFLFPIPSLASLLPPSLLFPCETGLSWRFVHLSISSQMLFRLCVYMCCAICWLHIWICVYETQGERAGSLWPSDINQVWPQLHPTLGLEVDIKGKKKNTKNYWIRCVSSQVNERMVKEFRAPDICMRGAGKAGKK